MALELMTAAGTAGPHLCCIVRGLPAGLEVDGATVDRDLFRYRVANVEEGARTEPDRAVITAGVRLGRTIGGPVALLVPAREEAELPIGREATAQVAGGALARAFLAEFGVDIGSRVDALPAGAFEVRARGVMPGLGSHLPWRYRLDGALGQAIMSIGSIVGAALGCEADPGGGLDDGVTTGEPVRVLGFAGHADHSTVAMASVIGEAMIAFTLADVYRRQLGGDNIADVKAAVASR